MYMCIYIQEKMMQMGRQTTEIKKVYMYVYIYVFVFMIMWKDRYRYLLISIHKYASVFICTHT
jgi:hypothetical protein